MARNDVHITMTAAEAQIVQAWLNANRGPKEYLRTLENISGKTGQANRATQGMMGAAVTGFRQLAASLIGISGPITAIVAAANILRREAEAMRKFQRESAEYQIPVGRMVEQMRLNQPAGSDITPEEIWQMITEKRLGGITDEEAMRTVLNALQKSESPERYREFSGMLIELIDRYQDLSQEDLQALAQAAVVVKRYEPGKDVTGEMLGAELMSALSVAPAGEANAEQFFNNLGVMMGNYMQQGFSRKESYDIATSLANRALDDSFEMGATFANNFLTDLVTTIGREKPELIGQGMKMMEFLQTDEGRKAATELAGSMERRTLADLKEAAGTRDIDEIMREALQVDKLGKAAYRGGAHARARYRMVVPEMVAAPEMFEEQRGDFWELYKNSQKAILTGQPAIDLSRQKQQAAMASEASLAYRKEKERKATAADLLGKSPVALREDRTTFLEEGHGKYPGYWYMEKLASQFRMSLENAMSPPVDAIKELEAGLRDMRAIERSIGAPFGVPMSVIPAGPEKDLDETWRNRLKEWEANRTQTERDRAAPLREEIRNVEKMLEALRAATPVPVENGAVPVVIRDGKVVAGQPVRQQGRTATDVHREHIDVLAGLSQKAPGVKDLGRDDIFDALSALVEEEDVVDRKTELSRLKTTLQLAEQDIGRVVENEPLTNVVDQAAPNTLAWNMTSDQRMLAHRRRNRTPEQRLQAEQVMRRIAEIDQEMANVPLVEEKPKEMPRAIPGFIGQGLMQQRVPPANPAQPKLDDVGSAMLNELQNINANLRNANRPGNGQQFDRVAAQLAMQTKQLRQGINVNVAGDRTARGATSARRSPAAAVVAMRLGNAGLDQWS